MLNYKVFYITTYSSLCDHYDKYNKTTDKGHSKRRQKYVFKTDYPLMQVKSIAECSKRAFCNTFDLHYFRPYVVKTFVLSIFEWPFKTGFTVLYPNLYLLYKW